MWDVGLGYAKTLRQSDHASQLLIGVTKSNLEMKFESMRWTGRIKHLQCGLWTLDDVGVYIPVVL